MKNSYIRKCKNARTALSAFLKSLRAECGQSLVELALTLPFFTLILLGSVEMYRVINASIEVSDAAMAGIQYGTRNPTSAVDTAGIQNAAAADAPGLTLTTTTSTSCICSDGSASTCQPTDCPNSNIETILTVQTQTTVQPTIQMPGLPTSYTLQGQAIQKVLQ